MAKYLASFCRDVDLSNTVADVFERGVGGWLVGMYGLWTVGTHRQVDALTSRHIDKWTHRQVDTF